MAARCVACRSGRLQYVSANFFQGLGGTPVIGRAFRDEEDRVGQEPVVIVSHRNWVERFGKPKTCSIAASGSITSPARIVGVAPPGFFGLRPGALDRRLCPTRGEGCLRVGSGDNAPQGEDDHDWWVRQVGRLKPGVPERAAKQQIAALFRNLASARRETPEDSRVDHIARPPRLQSLNPGMRTRYGF